MMQVAFIALLMEWVVVITTAAPLILTSARWGNLGRATIVAWFGSLFLAGILTVVALGCAVNFAFEFWVQLEARGTSSDRLFWAFVYSFLPWLVLALAGILLALINQRLEPLIGSRREVGRSMQNLPVQRLGKQVGNVEVFSLQLNAPLAFAWQLAHESRIVISTALVELLDEAELHAVTLHEHAHIAQRHQTLKRISTVARKVSPGIVAGRIFEAELQGLCEQAADDAVVSQGRKQELITALRKMQNVSPTPEVQARLHRLESKAK